MKQSLYYYLKMKFFQEEKTNRRILCIFQEAANRIVSELEEERSKKRTPK